MHHTGVPFNNIHSIYIENMSNYCICLTNNISVRPCKKICTSLARSVGRSMGCAFFFNHGIHAKRGFEFHQCPCSTYMTNTVVNAKKI